MVNLHYAPLDLGDSDIPVTQYPSIFNLLVGLYKKMIESENVVFLCALPDFQNEAGEWEAGEVYISSNPVMIENWLSKIEDESEVDVFTDVHLHEYDSFQTAYEVALDMKEVSKLCYSMLNEEEI